MKKTLAFLLVVAIFLTQVPIGALATGTAEYSDSASPVLASSYQNHWAEGYLNRAVAEGWVSAETADGLDLDAKISRGDFIEMINGMMGYSGSADLSEFEDVKSGDPYYDAFSTAVAADYIRGAGNGLLRPNSNLSRTEAFIMFARISELNTTEDNTSFTKGIPDWNESVPDWGKGAVASTIANGYVNGSNGMINGLGILSTGEALALLVRKHDDQRSYAFPGEYKVGSAGSIVIGGSNISVEIAEGAKVGAAIIEEGAVNARIIISTGAEVDKLDVKPGSEGSEVEMGEDAKIGTANLDAPVEVTGSGVITEANIGAPGVVIETPPETIEIADGVTAIIDGESVDQDTVHAPPATEPPVKPSPDPDPDPEPSVRYYTVTFESNGGSAVAPVTGVAAGSKIAAPIPPAKSGYSFVGWYKEAELTNEWNFDADVVNRSMTLYAKWTEASGETYTVTFESNGGSAVAPITGVAAGSKITAPIPPAKSGYSFVGWYKEAELTNVWDFDADVVNGDMTLYAGWMRNVAPTDFTIVAAGVSAGIYVDGVNDFPGVVTAVRNLKDDILAVSNVTPAISEVAFDAAELSGKQIIAGTIGKSPVIDQLITDGKLDVTDVAGKWESFVIQVVDDPVPGVSQALVIAGSDKRGTIFGIYEISEEIGVSPWHFWADAKPDEKSTVVIPYAKHKEGEPTVQFRGIFLNDEENLARWASQTYEPGKSMGPKVYETIFELLLRMKANYLWPAMHGISDAFNDYPENGRLADEMGIVIGSTHCDMLLRNNENEWRPWLSRNGYSTDTPYDYTIPASAEIMRRYWIDSIKQNKDYEVHWTVGLRDIHDKPLQTSQIPEGPNKTADTIALMEQIFADQYALLAEHAPNNSEYKMFIPYKEVLDLYNAGLEVPDDVTIMWIEDNHGYIRDLPNEQERQRSGGHGIYYHLSYWGPGKQSYMWLNSVPVPQMQSELKRALEHEANKIWILNVGDIKPMEVGMEFFLNYAWDATQWNDDANEFLDSWAEREFGAEHAEEIGDILAKYYQIGNARKPEHLEEGLFSNIFYGDEAQMRLSGFQDIFDRANTIYSELPSHKKDAFYEMVLYQIRGAYFLYKEFYYSQKSLDAAEAGKASAVNTYAALAKQARADLRADVVYYNNTLAGGKWKPIMGPEVSPPPVIPPQVKGAAELMLGQPSPGVLAEGYSAEEPGQTLTFFSYAKDTRFLDIFNKGAGSFSYTITADKSWIHITGNADTVIDEDRVFVTIDWAEVNDGDTGVITVTAGGATKTVNVAVSKPDITVGEKTYIEGSGYVSIEAEHFTEKTDVGGKSWSIIKELGRHSGDMMGAGPSNTVSIPFEDVKTQAPSLAYKVYFTSTGTFETEIYRFPTLMAKVGQRFAIAIDDEDPVLVEGVYDSASYDLGSKWEVAIFNQIEKLSADLTVDTAGEHTIKVWMIDGGIVLDKIVVYTAPRPVTYFGPPESYNSTYNPNPDPTYPEVARPVPAPQEPNSVSPWGEGYFVEESGKIAFEAEAANENSAYANIVNRKDGSFVMTEGESPADYILRLSDRGVHWAVALTDVPNVAPQLTYSVYVTTPGAYHMSVRAMSSDTASDSLFVGANGMVAAAITAGFTHNSWAWVTATVNLKAGLNTVHIWAREDGTRIDKVYLSRTSEAPPSPLIPSSRAVAEGNEFIDDLTALIAEVSARLTSIPLGSDVGDYAQAAYDALKAGIAAAEMLKLSPDLTQALLDETAAELRALRKVLDGSKNYDSGGADYRVYEDFEKNTVGEIPFGLAPVTIPANANVKVVTGPSDENKSLLVSSESGAANTTLYYYLGEPLSGKYVVEGRFRVPTSKTSTGQTNILYLGNATGGWLIGAAIQSEKLIIAGEGAQATNIDYTPGEWIHIKFEIDTEATSTAGTKGTVKLYVNDVHVPIGTNYDRLRAAAGTDPVLTRLMFGPNGADRAVGVDDLKVYPIADENPARDLLMAAIAAAMKDVNNIPVGNDIGDYAQAAYDALMAKIAEAKLLRYSSALDEAKVTALVDEFTALRAALFGSKNYDPDGMNYAVYENFNKHATGETPYGLRVTTLVNADVKVVNIPSSSNKSLLVTTGSGGSRNANLNYNLNRPLSGTVVVEGRYWVPSAGTSLWHNGLYVYNGGTVLTNVGFQTNLIRVNTTVGQKSATAYNTGEWVDIKLVIQTTEYETDGTTVKTPGKVTLYVNGEAVNFATDPKSNVTPEERYEIAPGVYSETDLKLRTQSSQITHIMFGGSTDGITMYIDDLKVYKDQGTVDPVDPEDELARTILSAAISTASVDLIKIPVGTEVGTYSQTAYNALHEKIQEAQALLASSAKLTEAGIDPIVSALVSLRAALLASKNYDPEGYNYAVYDDFNKNPLGEIPFGLVKMAVANDEDIKVVDHPSNADRSLMISTPANRKAQLYSYFNTPLGGKVVIEGRFKVPTANTTAWTNAMYAYDQNGSILYGVAFQNSKIRTADVAGASGQKDATSYTPGEWVNIKLVIDTEATNSKGTQGTATLYVNDILITVNGGDNFLRSAATADTKIGRIMFGPDNVTATMYINYLRAYQQLETHTVTFDSMGGSPVEPPMEVVSGRKITTPPAPPTKADCLFGGWYKEEGIENVWDFTADVVTGDITLYAKWIPAAEAVDFALADAGNAAKLYVSDGDATAVKRAVGDLKDDIGRVTNLTPDVVNDIAQLGDNAVIIGTIGQSPVIDQLIAEGRLDVTGVKGEWEAFVIQTVPHPVAGVRNALVIAGSDRRGTIFGVYDLSEQIGVSPWYWWADVTPKHQDTLIIEKGTKKDKPDVQYRGIFINDESNLAHWSEKHDPGKEIGPNTYKLVFELMLRLKANFLWPAMHEYVDGFNRYPETARIADEDYAIVVGSTHCDMMLRNNSDEWGPFALKEGLVTTATPDSNSAAEKAAYDYTVNPDAVYKYWEESVIKNKTYEAGWTVGMRGMHDQRFTTKNAPTVAEQVLVLDQIVKDQRKMLAEHVNPNVEDILQLCVIYAEVLELYNAGYRELLPDDVTIVFANDNFGYIRQLPDETERQRSGGAGVYYHISYQGGPGNYLWLDAQPLSLIWQEMTKAYEHGAQKLWVLNVGDIKPGEIGTEFFLNLAWDVDQYDETNFDQFLVDMAARDLDADHAEEIADIMMEYYELGFGRKPENQRLGLFSDKAYGDEGLKRVTAYEELTRRAEAIYDAIDEDRKDAFFQRVLYSVRSSYLFDKQFYYATRNYTAVLQDRQSSMANHTGLINDAYTQMMADVTYYNKTMAGGKWDGIMNPYDSRVTQIPGKPNTLELLPEAEAGMGIFAEGQEDENPVLGFSVYTRDNRFIDIYNRGGNSFAWTIEADKEWITFTKSGGTVVDEDRVWVSINWDEVPEGVSTGTVTISGPGGPKTVTVRVSNPASPKREDVDGYIEANGYVSIEAEHYYDLVEREGATWRTVKGLGRSGDAVWSYPVIENFIGKDVKTAAPELQYKIYFSSAGEFPVTVYRIPSLNEDEGTRYAIAMDDGEPVIVEGTFERLAPGWWINVMVNIETTTTNLTVDEPGYHTLKIWPVDSNIVIDKIVVDTGGVMPSYFGPPESYHSVYNTVPEPITPDLWRPVPTPITPQPREDMEWGEGTFIESGGKVCIEAEVAMENSENAYMIDRSEHTWWFSNGNSGYAMQCFPDVGDSWTNTGTLNSVAPELAYRVNFSRAGTYSVWMLLKRFDVASDSIHVGLDGNYRATITSGIYASYTWVKVGTIDVGAGIHTVNVWAREDGVMVDKIYLTTGTDTPSGAGPEMSTRGSALNIAELSLQLATAEDILTCAPLGEDLGDYSPEAVEPLQEALTAAKDVLDTGETQEELNSAADTLSVAIAEFRATRVMTQDGRVYSVYEDFDNYETILPYWDWDVNASGGTITLLEDDSDGMYAKADRTSGTVSLGAHFAPLTGKVIVEARVMKNSNSSGSALWPFVFSYPSAGFPTSSIAACFSFNPNGQINGTGKGGWTSGVATYEAGVWYEYKIVIDTETDKLDFYIDGVPKQTNMDLRYASDGISAVRFYIDGAVTNACVDYVQVYQEVGEP